MGWLLTTRSDADDRWDAIGACHPRELKARDAAIDRSGASCAYRMRLLGRFELWAEGQPIDVGASAQRLLAYLAVNDGRAPRCRTAGLLWPEVTGQRANANLRSTLWRFQHRCEVVAASAMDVQLGPLGAVDLWCASATARQLLDPLTRLPDEQLRRAINCNLREDLLPDWDEEDWLSTERDRFRQLRLHALESLSSRLSDAGWHGAAVDVALAAVAADPLRESGHLALIRSLLAEGNQRDASARYEEYRRLLQSELGLAPAALERSALSELMTGVVRAATSS